MVTLGPPYSPFEQEEEEDDDTVNIKMESNLAHSKTLLESGSEEESEEFGFRVTSNLPNNFLNDREGALENGEVEILEESCSEEEGEGRVVNPPPIPPRSHSLSPSPINVPFNSSGKVDIYDDNHLKSTGPFLSEGRGGEIAAPPLQRLVNGIANGENESTTLPPPLPTKMGRRGSSGPRLQGIAEEERMLMNELDLLEQLVDTKEMKGEENPASKPAPPSLDSEIERVESAVSEKQSRA